LNVIFLFILNTGCIDNTITYRTIHGWSAERIVLRATHSH
jgi:hypothetical protein